MAFSPSGRQSDLINLFFYAGVDGNEPIKPENVPLSVTYDSAQEPAYYPAPYASSRVPSYSEHCIQNTNVSQKNMGTFGSSRGGYTYDIPYPPRRVSSNI
ncbi:uncharacterized protein TNIN_349661 [Trichonephila inaurata madagascariensis]|uniref:Uncharacterized protein n=1 Tax=Trichonephila inaurata madagascariensis TaxID=2747483 RepID=A0A8X6XGB7_9ARAC|nr:uncharacterized protein TNIN_349661 [Trichonephila inaurata madagascariensis]